MYKRKTIFLLISIFLIFAGCDENSSNSKEQNQSLTSLKAQYHSIANKHNNLLRFVNNDLQNQQLSSRNEELAAIKKSGEKFFRGNLNYKQEKKGAIKFFDSKFSAQSRYLVPSIIKGAKNGSSTKHDEMQKIMDSDQFNYKQKMFLKRAAKVIDNNSKLSIISKKFNRIEQRAAKSLKTKKKIEANYRIYKCSQKIIFLLV